MWYHMKSSRSENYASSPLLRFFNPYFPPFHQVDPIGLALYVEYGPPLVVLDALVLEHTIVHAGVLALDAERGLRDDGLEDEVVIAVRAVLVGLLELLRVLAEALLALLARERHLEGLPQLVRLLLVVAVGAVEPLLACFSHPCREYMASRLLEHTVDRMKNTGRGMRGLGGLNGLVGDGRPTTW
jgi:hypothetical protein